MHAWALEAQRSTGGRVLRTESIHLTLAFLGEVDEARIAELKGLSVKSARHELPVEQARHWSRNQIVWVGPSEIPDALSALAGNLNETLLAKGFRIEKREFAAHVTLIRKARKRIPLPSLPAVSWPVNEFLLVRSQLSPDGSRYEIVTRFPLNRPSTAADCAGSGR